MGTLQTSNLHFESTGNNRIQYTGSNAYNLVAGGATIATVNTSTLKVVNIDFESNGALKIPIGTTEQRPSGQDGMFRYNTTTGKFEGHNASGWGAVVSSANTSDAGIVELATPAETQAGSDTARAVTPSGLASVITSWVAYTPTFTGLGTVTGISVFSRRNGDTLEIMGKFSAGTSTATETRMTLGFDGVDGGVTSDATKVPSIRLAGLGTVSGATVNQYTVLIESNLGYLTFGIQNATNAGLTKQNGNAWLNNSTISINARVPISGW
jgi:hypothetical protein